MERICASIVLIRAPRFSMPCTSVVRLMLSGSLGLNFGEDMVRRRTGRFETLHRKYKLADRHLPRKRPLRCDVVFD